MDQSGHKKRSENKFPLGHSPSAAVQIRFRDARGTPRHARDVRATARLFRRFARVSRDWSVVRIFPRFLRLIGPT
eukprot:4949228-Pyramimonas_sp.AAC.1